MKIIGLGHYSRTGKDTFADMIVDNCRSNGLTAKKVPLAWKLKQVCHELYGWAGLREPEFYDTKEGEGYRELKIRALDMTPVEIWVAFGTPAVRNKVYDRTWIDYVLQTDHKCDVLVVPDIRYPNEVKEFRLAGAKLIKVVREGFGPRNTEPDLALLGWDGWDLIAGTTMGSLRWQAISLADWAAEHIAFPTQVPWVRDMLLEKEAKNEPSDL